MNNGMINRMLYGQIILNRNENCFERINNLRTKKSGTVHRTRTNYRNIVKNSIVNLANI